LFLGSRKSAVTAERIETYRTLIETTTVDLEAHLQSIDEKFETIFGNAVTVSDSDTAELQLIKEERMSTQKCLQICAQLSDHINQIQLIPRRSYSFSEPIESEDLPERVTNEGLKQCKDSLYLTAATLERHMKNLIDRLVTKSKTAMTSEDDVADLARLREEWETARQCIDICSRADTHLKENISVIDNYSTGDAVQFLVSTDGKTIHGKNRGMGWRTRQVGGHLSDASLQQISRDMKINSQYIGNDRPSSSDNASSVTDEAVDNMLSPEYRERYGQGFRLASKSSPEIAMSSRESAEGGLGSSSKR
jgi:hypothetical protein